MRRKQLLIIVIILLVLVLGVGYAFLNTTLNITGTTDVDSNTWDIYWDNVQVTEGSVSASTPTIDTAKTTVSFSVHLSKPGDFYEFTVDAKNDGSVDAMIDSISNKLNGIEISTTNPLPTYLSYTIIYGDDFEITNNQLLPANSTETYKVRVEYRTDINPSDLPANAASLTFSFGINYVQADNNAKKVRNYRYWKSIQGSYRVGDQAPALANLICYDYIADGQNVFIRYTLDEDEIITEIVIGLFVDIHSQPFYLYPGSSQYERNVATLIEAFGEENCSESTSGTVTSYSCNFGSTGGFDPMSTVRDNGLVDATNDCVHCYVNNSGVSQCGPIHSAECYT